MTRSNVRPKTMKSDHRAHQQAIVGVPPTFTTAAFVGHEAVAAHAANSTRLAMR